MAQQLQGMGYGMSPSPVIVQQPQAMKLSERVELFVASGDLIYSNTFCVLSMKHAPEKEFEIVMQTLHKSDSVAPVYAKMVSAGIKVVYEKVAKEAGPVTAGKHKVGATDAETVDSIKKINTQIALDKLCKEVGLATGVDACSEDKIKVLKHAIKELETLEKGAEKANKGLRVSEDARLKAQEAIDEVAKANGVTGPATHASATAAVAEKLAANKAKLVEDIGVVVPGPVTEESLISAIAAAKSVTVPAPATPKTPATPPTPTPEAVAAKK